MGSRNRGDGTRASAHHKCRCFFRCSHGCPCQGSGASRECACEIGCLKSQESSSRLCCCNRNGSIRLRIPLAHAPTSLGQHTGHWVRVRLTRGRDPVGPGDEAENIYRTSPVVTGITASTVGYGDIRPTQRRSKLLSIMIAIMGIMFTGFIVAVSVNAATAALLENEEIRALQEQHPSRSN